MRRLSAILWRAKTAMRRLVSTYGFRGGKGGKSKSQPGQRQRAQRLQHPLHKRPHRGHIIDFLFFSFFFCLGIVISVRVVKPLPARAPKKIK
jgi:hypothetical protein